MSWYAITWGCRDQISMEVIKKFKQYAVDSEISSPFDFVVQVLNSNHWPISQSSELVNYRRM